MLVPYLKLNFSDKQTNYIAIIVLNPVVNYMADTTIEENNQIYESTMTQLHS